MRRTLYVLVPVFALGIAVPVSADHVEVVPDALDCQAMPAGVHPTTTSEQDRGAACVSDGDASNGAEYYLGGDARSENDYPDTPENEAESGEACGALVIGGEVASATRPDDPATAEDERLDWDYVHVHVNPDGTTTDHHHTCD